MTESIVSLIGGIAAAILGANLLSGSETRWVRRLKARSELWASLPPGRARQRLGELIERDAAYLTVIVGQQSPGRRRRRLALVTLGLASVALASPTVLVDFGVDVPSWAAFLVRFVSGTAMWFAILRLVMPTPRPDWEQ